MTSTHAVGEIAASTDATHLREITPLQWKSGIAAWLGWLFDGLELHLYTLVALPLVVQLLGVANASDPAVKEKSAFIQAAFLAGLPQRPSEYVKRQMRFTPYPTEDVGWIIQQAGPETVLFSSDYPHVEGGRRPIERFERSIDGCSDAARQAFYHDNFVDLMGPRLQSALVKA